MNDLRFYICGSSGEPSEDNPITVVQKEESIKVITQLLPQPVNFSEFENQLSDSEREVLHDLIRLGVIINDDQIIKLGFPCFSQKDLRLMDASMQRAAANVAKLFREDWPKIVGIIEGMGISSKASLPEKVYIILGCIILDWFALKWLQEDELLFYSKPQPNGSKYLIQSITNEAFEDAFSRFCYSTTFGSSKWKFTVFGQATGKRWVSPEIEI
ncbi:MAG: hypothetical protein ACTSU3_09155, partial [Candidatus Thorarchaeota archaeon]